MQNLHFWINPETGRFWRMQWRDEQGRRCTRFVGLAPASIREGAARIIEYNLANPLSEEDLEWARNRAKELGLL